MLAVSGSNQEATQPGDTRVRSLSLSSISVDRRDISRMAKSAFYGAIEKSVRYTLKFTVVLEAAERLLKVLFRHEF